MVLILVPKDVGLNNGRMVLILVPKDVGLNNGRAESCNSRTAVGATVVQQFHPHDKLFH